MLCFSLFLWACQPSSQTPTVASTLTPNAAVEWQVLAAALEHLYGPAPIYVVDKTRSLGFNLYEPERVSSLFPTVSQETIQDFVTQNETIQPFAAWPNRADIVLVERADFLQPLFCVETPCIDLAKLQQAYPGAVGVVMFSRVGLNASRDQALVMADIDDGDHQGTTYLLLLVRDGATWRVVAKDANDWVS